MNQKLFNDEKTINSVIKMAEDGMTRNEISECLGVSLNPLTDFCKTHKIIISSRSIIIPKHILLDVYDNPELTVKEKAASLGLNVAQLYDNLAYNNIQLLSNKSQDCYYKNDIPETDDDIITILRSKRTTYAKKCSILNVKLATLYDLYDKHYLKRTSKLEQLMVTYNRANNIKEIEQPKEQKQEISKLNNCFESIKLDSNNDITKDNVAEKGNSGLDNITINLTLNFNINQASFDIGDIIKQSVSSAIEQVLKR